MINDIENTPQIHIEELKTHSKYYTLIDQMMLTSDHHHKITTRFEDSAIQETFDVKSAQIYLRY